MMDSDGGVQQSLREGFFLIIFTLLNCARERRVLEVWRREILPGTPGHRLSSALPSQDAVLIGDR